MKIVLDITKLLEEWKITKEEYDKFSGLAKKETVWILPNILVWFGTILIFCWIASFAKSIEFIFALSVIFIGVWFFIREKLFKDWWILSSIFIILWTISASWAYFELFDFYSDWSELNYKIAIWSVALFIAAMSYFARSALLAGFSALTIWALLWVWTSYYSATYYFFVEQPSLTIVVYWALSILTYSLSNIFSSQIERLLLAFSRVSFFLVNMAFWIWSFWWDKEYFISNNLFSIWWLAFLIIMIIFWVVKNKRFTINMSVTFLSIHFYTQFFERFWVDPISFIIAWLFALIIAIALWKYNKKLN